MFHKIKFCKTIDNINNKTLFVKKLNIYYNIKNTFEKEKKNAYKV